MNAQKHATENHLQQVMTAAQYTAFTAVSSTLGSHSYNVTPRSLVTHLDGAEDEDGNALFMFEDGSGAMIDFEAPADLPEL